MFPDSFILPCVLHVVVFFCMCSEDLDGVVTSPEDSYNIEKRRQEREERLQRMYVFIILNLSLFCPKIRLFLIFRKEYLNKKVLNIKNKVFKK